MTRDSEAADRVLIEDAMRSILTGAPANWSRVVAEFEPPAQARAWAVSGSRSWPMEVPAEAVSKAMEYQRRAGSAGPAWRRAVVEVDNTGALLLRIEPSPGDPPSATTAGAKAVEVAAARRPSGSSTRRQIGFALWGAAAVVSITALAVAILGRDRGDEPTLRAMAASESMPDAQARAVAANTVRVWIRERNERHLANLEALSCPDSRGLVALEIADVKNHEPVGKAFRVVATGGFTRQGPVWTLNTHFDNGVSLMFIMRVRDGELRVYETGSAPVP